MRAGARLNPADQARLRDLNGQLSTAQTAFGQKLVAAAKAGALVVDDRTALAQTGLDIADVPPRYRSSYFQHIFAGGYAAGYYAHLWMRMLDNDAWAWFQSHGGLTRANGQRFRDMILSKGHSEDYAPMFRAFYGRDPDIGPMLEVRGLTQRAGRQGILK